MSLREWLILIGALIILGIVADGVRRMLRARRDSLEISRGMGADDIAGTPIDDDYNPELPNGGGRPVRRPANPPGGGGTGSGPEAAPPGDQETARWVEPPLRAEREEPGMEPPLDSAGTGRESAAEPETPTVGPAEPAPMPDKPAPAPAEEESDSRAGMEPQGPDTERPLAGANRPDAQEVLVINVHAPAGQFYGGNALRQLFEACGLEHGDLGIYHRHEEPDTRSPVQFSVANAVEPGSFDPPNMADMTTPGISFFMSLPGPEKPLQAFDYMLETAQTVARNLGGELKDERRSDMTGQTIEHCRQRIREYERKRRFARA